MKSARGRSLTTPMMIWAARELMRHPLQVSLLFVGLSATVALVGLILLFSQATTRTCFRLLESAPDVVVRRVNAGGWAPLPVNAALVHARQVPGVLRPRTRLWGVVLSKSGSALTVMGRKPDGGESAGWPRELLSPAPGQAMVGSDVEDGEAIGRLNLIGRTELTLKVVGRLPEDSALAVGDVVVVHEDDARRLLGLGAGQASDLVLDVFRDEEVAAVCDELAAVFPWPVQISTRQANLALCLRHVVRRSGVGLFSCVPAVLAMVCLLLATGSWSNRQQPIMGLLKALGWTGGDIFRLQSYGVGLVAGPAAAAGLGTAYGLLFCPGLTGWMGHLFGWPGSTVLLMPTIQGVGAAFGLTLLLVVVPYVCVGLWSARAAVLADPGELLQV